jgi:archaellum component FlaC
MANDGPSSTVRVDSDSSGASSDIKGLGDTFGGLFSTIAGGAAVGGLMADGILAGLVAVKAAVMAPYEAVKGLVTSFADAGDKIFTMSRQTGQSAAALSTYKYIADQTGASVEGISNATFKMSINIAKGGKTVESAFKAIGTSVKEIRDLSPEEQFAKIMNGLGGIPDAGQRALVGTQIFGKGFKEIAQLADEDLAALTDNAKTFGLVMSDEMAAAGDAFGDTLGDLSSILTGLKNTLGAVLLPVVNSFIGTIRDEAIVVLKMLKDTFGPLFSGVETFKGGLIETTDSAEFHTKVLHALVTVIAGLIDAFAGLVRAAGFVIGAYYDMRTAGDLLLVAFGKVVAGMLIGAQQIAIGMSKISFGDTKASFQRDADELGAKLAQVRSDMKGLGENAADLQKTKEALSNTLTTFADKLSTGATRLREQSAAYQGVATAADVTRPKVHGLGDDIDGLGEDAKKTKEKINEFANTASVQIAKLKDEWDKQTPAVKANQESINILLDKYVALRAKVTNKAALPAELEDLAAKFGKINQISVGTVDQLDTIIGKLPKVKLDIPTIIPDFKIVQANLESIGEKTFNWAQSEVDAMDKAAKLKEEAKRLAMEGLDRIINSLTQIGQIAPGALGAVAQGIGVVLGSLKAGVSGVDSFKAGLSAVNKGDVLSGLGSIATGIGGIIAAASVAVGLFKKLFGAEGRKTVEEFAGEHGGFDALHNELLALGDEGEQLWIKLTQGVGRNNPEQAKQVIDEVTAALEKQKTKQDAAQDATEEGAAATIETATQASQALDTLGEKLRENEGDWDHWSSVVTAFIKNVAHEVDGVSVGHSPGGIKEWKPMLEQAMGSFETFSSRSVANLRRVKSEVDTFGGIKSGAAVNATVTGAGAMAPGGGNLTIAPGAIVIDRPILKDRESIMELSVEVGKRLKEAWGSQGVW